RLRLPHGLPSQAEYVVPHDDRVKLCITAKSAARWQIWVIRVGATPGRYSACVWIGRPEFQARKIAARLVRRQAGNPRGIDKTECKIGAVPCDFRSCLLQYLRPRFLALRAQAVRSPMTLSKLASSMTSPASTPTSAAQVRSLPHEWRSRMPAAPCSAS